MRARKLIISFMLTAAIIATPIFLYLLFTGPEMSNQSNIKTFEICSPPFLTESIPWNYKEYNLTHSGGNHLEPVKANILSGKLYYNYYCTACHGENLDGNGPVGQSYTPKPTDLNNDSIKTLKDEILYERILEGSGHSPVLEKVIPQKYMWYIVLYIKN